MSLFRTLMSIVMLWLGASLHGQALKMDLLATIPLKQLSVEPLKWDSPSDNEDWLKDPAFGFIGGGKVVFFGRGGWIYDLELRKLEKRLPDTMYWPIPCADGNVLVASVKDKNSPWFGRLAWFDAKGEILPKPKWTTSVYPKYSALHPNGRILAMLDPDTRNLHYFSGLLFIDLQTGEKWKADITARCASSEIYYFTADGRYLMLFDDPASDVRYFDTRTMKLTPKNQDEVGIPNHDASCVAGFSEDFDNNGKQVALFLWDRLKKQYIWQGKPLGGPVCFSNNDAYLLVRGGNIALSSTGEVVLKDLKGKNGKFSPDGRSLVTVDDEAFYIYTLPKDSEPIFGVFQKPEPWSPPKAKVAAPKAGPKK